MITLSAAEPPVTAGDVWLRVAVLVILCIAAVILRGIDRAEMRRQRDR